VAAVGRDLSALARHIRMPRDALQRRLKTLGIDPLDTM
jgi:hypothetical protein